MTTLTVNLPVSPLPPSTLSTLSVDYNSAKTQLQSLLVASGAPWQALLPTETGDTLVSLIATVHASAQQNILRSFQDVFPNTAVADSAIYAAATMQGVRLDRMTPAAISVSITNNGSSSVSIPAYTTFSGANTYWYNNDSTSGVLTVAPGGTITGILYQGKVKTVSLAGLGSPSQLYSSQETGFSVSNLDTVVAITNSGGTVVLPKHTTGLWAAQKATVAGSNPTTLGYVDRTLPNGALLVEFGEGTYGYMPKVSDSVSVRYVVTNGASANSVNALNKAIIATGYPTLTITATTNPIGGSDQTPSLLYKNIAAYSFGTFGSAVNRNQHIVTALNYPGIKDAITFSEREIQRQDLRWMNLTQVTVLANVPFSLSQQLEPTIQAPAYIRYLEKSTNYSTRFYLVEPAALVTNVVASVYCKSWASLVVAKNNAQAAITDLFSKATLNYDVMVTDMTSAMLDAYSGIDYIDLLSPTKDLIISDPQLPSPSIVVSPTGGTISALLSSGSLVYAVGYTTATSIVYPDNQVFSTIITGITNQATVTWEPVSSAISYQLYGRGAAGWGIIYSGPLLTFVDTGSVAIPPFTPLVGMPSKVVQYNKLGTLTINTFFSKRSTVS